MCAMHHVCHLCSRACNSALRWNLMVPCEQGHMLGRCASLDAHMQGYMQGCMHAHMQGGTRMQVLHTHARVHALTYAMCYMDLVQTNPQQGICAPAASHAAAMVALYRGSLACACHPAPTCTATKNGSCMDGCCPRLLCTLDQVDAFNAGAGSGACMAADWHRCMLAAALSTA